MGWNSWNHFGDKVDDKTIRAAGADEPVKPYDIRAKKNLGAFTGTYTTTMVPPHGVILMRARAEHCLG